MRCGGGEWRSERDERLDVWISPRDCEGTRLNERERSDGSWTLRCREQCAYAAVGVADEVCAVPEQSGYVGGVDREVSASNGWTLKIATASQHEQLEAIGEWALRGPVILGRIAAGTTAMHQHDRLPFAPNRDVQIGLCSLNQLDSLLQQR